jgi:hypothetical protein
MKINNVVVLFGFKPGNYFVNLIFNCKNLADVWILAQDGREGIPGQIMKFGFGIAGFDATHNGCGKHNVANGTKPDDEDFFQS